MSKQNMTLTDRIEMPSVGFGTYLIEDKEAEGIVAQALELGYRHIDTAEGYANEAGVGRALRASALSRDDVFITSKLWPGYEQWGQSPKSRQDSLAACESSLEKLQSDYIDLYLIHAPSRQEHLLEQWQALLDLQAAGKVRSIGVSNFTQAHIQMIADAGLPLPHANQIELHPWSQKTDLVAYLKSQGIGPIAYSSLVPLSSWRAKAGQGSAKTPAMQQDSESQQSPFATMAAKYDVSESQLLLHWGVQSGYPVIPKSTHAERMQQNQEIFGFEIDAADMQAIAGMDRGPGVAWAQGDPMQMA